MKKSIWAVLGLFIAGVVLAEQINAIMFNPSRLGLYQQLRVTKQVESSGNLTAGTTYVKGDTTASANSYEIVNVNAQKGTVDMRGGETEMVVNGPMNIKGGKAQFTAASTLPQLPTNTWIKADEGGLTMGAVTLNGNGNKFNTGTLRGLELGPNDIPLAPSECTGALDWVERKASNSSIYQVLAVKGCSDSGSSEQTCTENPNQEKCCTQAGYAWYPRGPSSRSGGTTNCCTTTTTTSTVKEEYYVSPSYEAESEWIWSQMRPINMNPDYAFTGTILKGSCNDYLSGFEDDMDVTWGYNACTAVPDLAGGSACDTYAYTNCSTVGYDAPVCERKELVSFRCVCK